MNDNGVSRRHARIVSQSGRHFVEDLESSNGTWVCGERVTRRLLADGDIVRFGPRAAFRFSWMDQAQEQLMQRLYESSTVDPLTGAVNRQHFEQRLESEIAYSRRHRSDLCLVLFDVDHFKSVNDTHGHSVGDRVLQSVCRVAANSLRKEDLFARYGGEEFALLLRGIPIEGAVRAAQRVRAGVAAHELKLENKTLSVTVSGGCAAITETDGTGMSLIDLADRRLYVAKRQGRNRIEGPHVVHSR